MRFWGKEGVSIAFHYEEVKDKDESLTFIKGYEVGWDIPVLLSRDKGNYGNIALLNRALMIGYWMGVEASKHIQEVEGNGEEL